jgi:hypothetical protein
MSEEFDFERYWLDKFSSCLEHFAGETIRDQVMQGSQGLTMESDRREVVTWSCLAMQRLDELTDDQQRHDIMTGCACQYPKEDLVEVRQVYQRNGLQAAHQLLQERFERFLGDTLQLEPSMIEEVVRRGWGLAGELQGNKIIATKIPKSGHLIDYLNESDPDKQRAYYCHCPRVREAIRWSHGDSPVLSSTYCYCGAGYYRGIWERILEQRVEVEVLESVLQGDQACKIVIYLPVE